MRHRIKLFLTLSALCVLPLLILSVISFWSGVKSVEVLLRQDLEDDRKELAHHYQSLAGVHERELLVLAGGPLPDYLRNARTEAAVASIDPTLDASAEQKSEVGKAAGLAITRLSAQSDYAEIACFDADHRQMFLAQPLANRAPVFRTADFLPGFVEPDSHVWSAKRDSPICSIVTHPILGDVRRCTIPIFLADSLDSASVRGALVADLKLDRLISETGFNGGATEAPKLGRQLIVLDAVGKIVYHEDVLLVNQAVSVAMPGMTTLVDAMRSGNDAATGEYRSKEGETWLVAYGPIDIPGLSLVVARNYSLATQSTRRAGWLGIALSIVFGFAAGGMLTAAFQKKTQRIERVTESVAAIAGGDLDQRVDLRSSDDLRVLADSVNSMTERLRQQIARETEARQLESFVKLSAMLTHDLKNAIAGLSLMVNNMEHHFDDPTFRVDAMKSLMIATDKLRTLVSRLSKPLSTMSGEFRLPRPTDLVPIINRVLDLTAVPLRDKHQIVVNLPPSLIALADAEHIEEVIENLVLNALEAMVRKGGILTLAGGGAGSDRVFFSVTDTGIGMTQKFIDERLFHPFATQKSDGVGLGLYSCREVVKALGGKIEVESKAGAGTTFRVVLASAEFKEANSLTRQAATAAPFER